MSRQKRLRAETRASGGSVDVVTDKLSRSVDASISLANDVVRLEAELAAARERDATLREALRAIANMAGAAGPGEVPAMPIARRARAALAASPSAEEPQP